jgi:sulfide:quinone oxidoreductase
MKLRVVVLGAGFGGLDLSTVLSDAIGDNLDLTLIDKNVTFLFGFSKLDVMFGRKAPDAVRLPYRNIVKPGVQFHQETITAIYPKARCITTDRVTYDADVLVIALGADYDQSAAPGLVQGGNEFYSFTGAVQVPTSAERSCVIIARLSNYARRLRDQPRHSIRHSDSPISCNLQSIDYNLC